MVIPLLQPQDGSVGADFIHFDPSQPSNGGLFFNWGEPVFNSGAAPTTKTFTVQVATSPAFNNVVASTEVTNIYTAALSIDLLPETLYYWRVNCNGEISGNFNAFYTTLMTPILTSANNISIAGNSIEVRWNNLPTNTNANNIRLRYGTAPGVYTNSVVVPAAPKFATIAGLQKNTNYYFVGVAEGSIDFNYETALANAGLNTIITDDETLVIIEDYNMVVV